MSREVVVVDGIRTPYARAGTELKDVPAEELGRIVITELLARTEFVPSWLIGTKDARVTIEERQCWPSHPFLDEKNK